MVEHRLDPVLRAGDGAVNAFVREEQRTTNAMGLRHGEQRFTQRGGVGEGGETVKGTDADHGRAFTPIRWLQPDGQPRQCCHRGITVAALQPSYTTQSAIGDAWACGIGDCPFRLPSICLPMTTDTSRLAQGNGQRSIPPLGSALSALFTEYFQVQSNAKLDRSIIRNPSINALTKLRLIFMFKTSFVRF